MLDEKNNPNLEEFYYVLEEALINRPIICEGLEDIEHIPLDRNTTDPYLQGLYHKHGIFSTSDLKQAYQIFEKINKAELSYPSWKNMKISIRAFVSNQLSLFHLGYQGVTHRDLKLSDEYLQESIKLGNRLAIESYAHELLNDYFDNQDDKDKLNKATILLEQAKKFGSKTAIIDLVDCYRQKTHYGLMLNAYDEIINKLKLHNYFPQCSGDFNKMTENQQKCYKIIFIKLLLNGEQCNERKEIMYEHRHLFTEENLDLVFSPDVASCEMLYSHFDFKINDNIALNLLFIFNNNLLLYTKYMSKLLRSLLFAHKVKDILCIDNQKPNVDN